MGVRRTIADFEFRITGSIRKEIIESHSVALVKKNTVFINLQSKICNLKSFGGFVTQKNEKMEFNQRDLVRIHTVENRFEADLLVQALRQENIPVLLRRFEETAYDGLFVTQMGWGAILVPGDYEEEAAHVVSRVLGSITHGVLKESVTGEEE